MDPGFLDLLQSLGAPAVLVALFGLYFRFHDLPSKVNTLTKVLDEERHYREEGKKAFAKIEKLEKVTSDIYQFTHKLDRENFHAEFKFMLEGLKDIDKTLNELEGQLKWGFPALQDLVRNMDQLLTELNKIQGDK